MGNLCGRRTYKDGKLHSYDDKPISNLVQDIWYDSGIIHRDNGPAIITYHEIKAYYKYGKLHRSCSLPAVEFPDGSEIYAVDGVYHRDGDKPSVIIVKNDSYYDEKSPIEESISHINITLYNKLLDEGLIGECNRDIYIEHIVKYWFEGKILNRDGDKPAIESDVCFIWIKNNKIHRDNGPAVIYADGTCEFWIDNEKMNLMQQYKSTNVKSAYH